jgi:L-alanine-DL-glutamate epimerase-like enolase superfamily enzyme
MKRREFIKSGPLLSLGSAAALGMLSETAAEASPLPLPLPPPLPFQSEKSNLKITGVRMVKPRPKKPVPSYEPTPGSWASGAEVASPMSIYPKYKARRSSFQAHDMGEEYVEISTDKGVKGIGYGGPGARFIIDHHLSYLIMGEDPFNVEELWDMMWRASESYGRKGVAVHAISAIELALWDIIGITMGMPVYKLLGGETKSRIPAYCTDNDVEQHLEFGYKKVKLAVPYGPADGREGMKKNVELVKRTRALLGPDGDLMIDAWMSLTERYTLELAEMLEPYRVYWMEECLPPDDYAGFGRLNAQIKSTRIATGEHEYTRWGFRLLRDYQAAGIWQPDLNWCGGLSEMRHIGALAAAYDIPVIPHGGWRGGCQHYILATTNSPWCEMFMPAPGGPDVVYKQFEEDNNITRGPEGIYVRPSDRPGFGWELIVD